MKEHDFAIALAMLNSVNISRRAKLYEYFQSFQSIWSGSENDFTKAGLTENGAKEVYNEIKINKPTDLCKNIKPEVRTLIQTDVDWPRFSNRGVSQQPTILFARGQNPRGKAMVSVVGPRYPSSHAEIVCKKIVKNLVDYGVVIISGLAIGIDKIAHETCLENNGKTCAFLASGAGVIYPNSHTDLANKIIKNGGAIFTEYATGEPSRERFPERNRLIAGYSDAVVIIEAKEDSGTIWTAEWARKLHIPLFAVPADTTRESAKGSNILLEKGFAKPIISADILLRELNITMSKKVQKEKIILLENEAKVYKCLNLEPKLINDICLESNMDTASVSSILIDMELKNLCTEMIDGWIVNQ